MEDRFKFRAWDKRMKEMINNVFVGDTFIWLYDHEEDLYEDWAHWDANEESVSTNFKNVEIMQSTGLKDKNGKLIFEGDVIKCEDIIEGFGKLLTCTIHYSKKRSSLRPREIEINTRGKRYYNEWLFVEDIEIIGNIHQDPNLLNTPTKKGNEDE